MLTSAIAVRALATVMPSTWSLEGSSKRISFVLCVKATDSTTLNVRNSLVVKAVGDPSMETVPDTAAVAVAIPAQPSHHRVRDLPCSLFPLTVCAVTTRGRAKEYTDDSRELQAPRTTAESMFLYRGGSVPREMSLVCQVGLKFIVKDPVRCVVVYR